MNRIIRTAVLLLVLPGLFLGIVDSSPALEPSEPFAVVTASDLIEMSRAALVLELKDRAQARASVRLVEPGFGRSWLPQIPGVTITLLTDDQARAADAHGGEYYCFVAFVLRRGCVEVHLGRGNRTSLVGTVYQFKREGSNWVGKPHGNFGESLGYSFPGKCAAELAVAPEPAPLA